MSVLPPTKGTEVFIDFVEIEDWFTKKIVPLLPPEGVADHVAYRKVAEEMGEWLDKPSPEEAIDVIASLYLWLRFQGEHPQMILDSKVEVLEKRDWEILPDGRWKHIKGETSDQA